MIQTTNSAYGYFLSSSVIGLVDRRAGYAEKQGVLLLCSEFLRSNLISVNTCLFGSNAKALWAMHQAD